MTDINRLIIVINEIYEILTEYGHTDFAERLNEQASTLSDPTSSSAAVREALETLHKAVNGMGGLNDLWLSAPTHSDSVRIREHLYALSDELYRMTE